MMNNPFDEAQYLPIPELSPYTKHDRYENPKEIFKTVASKLAEISDPTKSYRYADVATANGELLYFMRKQFPGWHFTGYDITPEFIETGRAFSGLNGIELHVADLYDIKDKFDVISFVNVMTAIWDAEEPLAHLLSLVNKGGILMVDGCFNKYDIEFRAVFMDNSKPESAGQWRRECSQHSRKSIAQFLEGRCSHFEFDDIVMDIDIPRKKCAPDSNIWTFRDENGDRHITNGTNMMMEKSLLTVYV